MSSNIPSPMELQKEITEFLKKKYGDRIAVPNPETQGPPPQDEVPPEKKSKVKFDLKPEELEAHLMKYVINQEAAIEVLSTKICTHFNRMNLEMNNPSAREIVGNIKSNVIMLGPTGVGKTYLVKLIAKKIGVPFVKGDATKFSETGYVGGDVEDLIRELVQEADGDFELAEYGIVYLDEIDKIAGSGSQFGPDVSRTGVQRNLLKLMEESEVELRPPHDLASQMEAVMEAQRKGRVERKKINTKNILFVVSGAFAGLEDIIRKRLKKHAIGFDAERITTNGEQKVDFLAHAKSEDLIDFGFESEFVGRLPVMVRLNDLDEEALYRILKSPDSVVIQSKKRDFQAYGIEVEFEDGALRLLAQRAAQERTGARGLVSVFENTLLKYEKKLPSTSIKKFSVTQEMVEEPIEGLEKLILNESLKSFQKEFLASTGIIISFTPDAKERLVREAKAENKTYKDKCRELFANYEYGLKLLELSNFTVDNKVLDDPQGTLEALIKQNYKH